MCPGPSAGLAVPAFGSGCPMGRRHAAFGISSAKQGRTAPQISSTQTPAKIFIRPPDEAKGSAELPRVKRLTLGNGIENRYSRQAEPLKRVGDMEVPSCGISFFVACF